VGKAYSMDYRAAVAAAYDECGSSAEVAEQFGCSESWVRRLVQQRRQRGTLEPRSCARHDDQRTYDDADERAIRELIRRKPDATLAEVAQALGKPAHASTVSRTLGRLDLPRKKSPRTPPSRTAPT
jgi:transposase